MKYLLHLLIKQIKIDYKGKEVNYLIDPIFSAFNPIQHIVELPSAQSVIKN